MQRPRVLITGPAPPPPGGIAAVIRTIVESDLAARFDFVRFDTTIARRAPGSILARHWNSFLSRAVGFDGAWNLEAAAKLVAFRAALEPRPDLVHLHTSHGYDFWLGIRMARVARDLDIPVLLHVHGTFDVVVPTWSRIKQHLFRRALLVPTRVVVLSHGWQRWFAERMTPDRIAVLGNAVDVHVFEKRTDARPADAPVNLLFVGTNEPIRKGGYEILAAAPAIIEAAPNVRFVFVGADLERLEERFVRGTALEPYFRFVGSKTAAAMIPYFEEAEVLLLPSHAEGLPIALLEGMAASLPVVACAVNGIPEAMREPENGLFVPVGDPPAIARAVIRLVGDPSLRRSIGAANRRRAEAEFDRIPFARNLGAIYDAVLDESARG